jgi:hypothetical protein
VLTCKAWPLANSLEEHYTEIAVQLIEYYIMKPVYYTFISVADNFGVSTYAVFLFLLTIWWSFNWGDATACPYTHVEDVVLGNTDVRTAVLKSAFELAGGVLVFK